MSNPVELLKAKLRLMNYDVDDPSFDNWSKKDWVSVNKKVKDGFTAKMLVVAEAQGDTKVFELLSKSCKKYLCVDDPEFDSWSTKDWCDVFLGLKGEIYLDDEDNPGHPLSLRCLERDDDRFVRAVREGNRAYVTFMMPSYELHFLEDVIQRFKKSSYDSYDNWTSDRDYWIEKIRKPNKAKDQSLVRLVRKRVKQLRDLEKMHDRTIDAVYKGDLKKLQELLPRLNEVTDGDFGFHDLADEALMGIGARGDLEVVKLLVSHFDAHKGMFVRACCLEKLEVLEYLIPLMDAESIESVMEDALSHSLHTGVLQILLPHVRDAELLNVPLTSAAVRGKVDVVKMLVPLVSKASVKQALRAARKEKRSVVSEVIKILDVLMEGESDHEEEDECFDKDSEAALYAAIRRGDTVEAWRIFDLHEEERAPLFHAILDYINAAENNMEMVKDLADYGMCHDYFAQFDLDPYDKMLREIENEDARVIVEKIKCR